MVGGPEPGVFEVDACLLGDVEGEESGGTFFDGGGCGGDVWVFGTRVGLEVCACEATETEVRVPHAGRALLIFGFGEIPLYQDGAWGGTFGGEDEIADFNTAALAGFPDLEEGFGVLLIAKGGAVGHDDGPDFAGDLAVCGDFDGVCDDVRTMIEVDDGVVVGGIKDLLQRSCVVGFAITFGALSLDTDERGDGYGLVLRFGTLKDLARFVEQRRWFLDG